MKTDAIERFNKMWVLCEETGCWVWIACRDPRGYGNFHYRGMTRAHRVSLVLHGTTIPDGLVVDHLCRVRACVNPQHLRVVTQRTNALENSAGFAARYARQTHCKYGHPLSGDNLYSGLRADRTSRKRGCRICRAKDRRTYRAKGIKS